MTHKSTKRPDVLAQWSRLPVTAAASAARAARRQRLVNAAVRVIENARPRRPAGARLYQYVGLGAAAAVLIVVAGFWCLRTPHERFGAIAHRLVGASSNHDGKTVSSATAPVGSTASAEPALASSAAGGDHGILSRWQLASGVEVASGRGARLTPPDEGAPSNARQELILDMGFITVSVPKLPPGHSFSVRTPDALVSVHGTSFSVEVTKTGQSPVPTTTVVVTSGVVTVEHFRREWRLTPGMQWVSPEDHPAAAEGRSWSGPAAPGSRGAAPRREERSTPASATPAETAGAPAGVERKPELAIQNRLFANAMNARERGDSAMAVRLLEDFLRRYPQSPLVQDAQVETFRAFVQMGDRAAAARAARLYLVLYGGGFAADEARGLALGN